MLTINPAFQKKAEFPEKQDKNKTKKNDAPCFFWRVKEVITTTQAT